MGPVVAAVVMAAGLPALAVGGPLTPFVGHARVLVVSAPAESDPELRRQDEVLKAEARGLVERDLVLIRAVGAAVVGPGREPLDAAAVRRAAGLSSHAFGVALIGKDGGVKLRRSRAIAASELFSTIDAMPMRQAEMRRAPR